jgi:hypothetical protein
VQARNLYLIATVLHIAEAAMNMQRLLAEVRRVFQAPGDYRMQEGRYAVWTTERPAFASGMRSMMRKQNTVKKIGVIDLGYNYMIPLSVK